jgi:hypothetical protein
MRTQRILALGFNINSGKVEEADLKVVDSWLDQGWTVNSIDAMGTGPMVVVLDAPKEEGEN